MVRIMSCKSATSTVVPNRLRLLRISYGFVIPFAVTGNQFGMQRVAGTSLLLAIRRYRDVSSHRFDIEVAMRPLVDELRKVP